MSRRLLSARMTMSLGAVYTGLKEEELTMRGRRRRRRRLNTRIANGIERWRREVEEVEVVHVVLVVVMCLWSGRAGVRMCSER